jgi:hypothetical protein
MGLKKGQRIAAMHRVIAEMVPSACGFDWV